MSDSIDTLVPDARRPGAVEAERRGGGYRRIVADESGRVTGTVEYRVEHIGHAPCGWNHPTWPDEAEGRLAAHKLTCELRVEGES